MQFQRVIGAGVVLVVAVSLGACSASASDRYANSIRVDGFRLSYQGERPGTTTKVYVGRADADLTKVIHSDGWNPGPAPDWPAGPLYQLVLSSSEEIEDGTCALYVAKYKEGKGPLSTDNLSDDELADVKAGKSMVVAITSSCLGYAK